MLIYTTMKTVQGEDKDRLLVSTLVSASKPEEDSRSSVGLPEAARTKQDREDSTRHDGVKCV